MQTMKKALSVIMILSVFTQTFLIRPAQATISLKDLTPGDIQDLKDALQACDKVVNDCEDMKLKKDSVINQQQRMLVAQQTEIENLKEDQNSFWNSHLLWATIGVVVVGSVALIAKGVVK